MISDIETFITDHDFSASTSQSYRYCLGCFSAWLEDRRIEPRNITANTVSAYLSRRRWSPNTRRLHGNAIKSFLRWQNKEHPALSVKLPRDGGRPGRTLNRDQVADLTASFNTMTPLGWRNLAIVSLMVETGLRASEVANLQVRDVDLAKLSLYAYTKGRKWQVKVFTQETARFLCVWLGAREAIAKPDVPYLFVGVSGKTPGQKMTRHGLRKLFSYWGKAADVGRLSPHDLRRTMATLLTEAGAPSRLVQELGGWSDIRMVQRYTEAIRPGQIEKYSPIRSIMNE